MPTSLGPAEILVILVVALMVLGPKRLPEAGRQVGRAIAEVRKWSQGFQDEIRGAIDPNVAPTYSPPPGTDAPAPPAPAPPAQGPPPPGPATPAEAEYTGPIPDSGANGVQIDGLTGATVVDVPEIVHHDTAPTETVPTETVPTDTVAPSNVPAETVSDAPQGPIPPESPSPPAGAAPHS